MSEEEEEEEKDVSLQERVCEDQRWFLVLTAAHHLHADQASGPGQASHAGQHASGTHPLAHQGSSAAPHVALGTPALLHGAPHGAVAQHVCQKETGTIRREAGTTNRHYFFSPQTCVGHGGVGSHHALLLQL